MKVSLNIPDELLVRIDEQAKSLSLSRSAYVSMTVTKAIQTEKILNSLPKVMEMNEKILSQLDK